MLRLSEHFTVGNAGDIFALTLLEHLYKSISITLTTQLRPRLLCMGSISHFVKNGDVICGIGAMRNTFSAGLRPERCYVHALRGPLTYELFKSRGFDLTNITFLRDPGLLIKFFVNAQDLAATPNGAAFIPHYKERSLYRRRMPSGIMLVDIDNDPIHIAQQILHFEHIYTSSLHGIIFAHALGRPCTFVRPQTGSLFKYKDYYASIDIPFPSPLSSIHDYNFLRDSHSPLTLSIAWEDFPFPSREELIKTGVINVDSPENTPIS